jgi:hypothetical protein
LTAPVNEEIKFSTLLKDEKTYTIEADRKPLIDAERFKPKPEVCLEFFSDNFSILVHKSQV